MKAERKSTSTNSEYLLTHLYKMPFFRRMKPYEILAFLIPYVDGYNNLIPTTNETISNKMEMLKEGLLGQYQNAASQGFAKNSLHSPSITFPYYYERLSQLMQYVKREFTKHEEEQHSVSWSEWSAEDCNIESEYMKQSIQCMLMLPKLYFQRNREVYRDDRGKLIEHLHKYGNQYVIAELLYYITHPNHELPDVNLQLQEEMRGKLSPKLLSRPNISCGFRLDFNETFEEMQEKLSRIQKLKLLCLNGNTFLDEGLDDKNEHFFSLLKARLESGKPISVEVLLQESNSKAAKEAAQNRMSPDCPKVPKAELISNSISGLSKLKQMANDSVWAKFTKIQIPYALCFYYFDESFLDYVKVDIYSPLISTHDSRPSMIIFRKMNEKLFSHFEETFLKIWNDEDNSSFLW